MWLVQEEGLHHPWCSFDGGLDDGEETQEVETAL